MEEIKQSISLDLPYVRLYLDDIEEILEMLKNENPKPIVLKTKNKLFNIEEIDKLNVEKINHLEISASLPDHITFDITFNKWGSHIYCYDNNTQTQGITRKIETFLIKKSRALGTLARNKFAPCFLGAMIPILLIALSKSEFLNLTSLIIIYLIFLFSIYLALAYRNIIFLKPKKIYKNIFVRNQDQLFVQILAGVLLSILAFFLGRYSK